MNEPQRLFRCYLPQVGIACRMMGIVLVLFLGPAECPVLGADSPTATGKSETASPPPDPLFEDLRKGLADSELTDEEKASLVATIDRAASQSAEAVVQGDAATDYADKLAAVDERVRTLQEKLADEPDVEWAPPIGGTLGEMEAELAKIEAQGSAAKQAVEKAEAEMNRSTQRIGEIDSEIPQLKSLLDERRSQIAAATNDGSIESEIKRVELASSERLLQAQLVAAENERALLSRQAAVGLPQLNRDWAAREWESIARRLERLQQATEDRRSMDAAQRVETAKDQLDTLHPALAAIGQANQTLADRNQQLATDTQRTEATLKQRTEQLESIRESFAKAKERVDGVGLTDAVGALLRNLKQTLPSVGVYQMRLRSRASEINDAQYALMELNDRRNANLDRAADQWLSESSVPIGYEDRDWLLEEAKQLLREQRSEYLDPAIRNQTNYFNALVSLSTTEREIVNQVGDSTRYVNERVFWVRSTPPLPAQWFPGREEWWFLFGETWEGLGAQFLEDLQDRWVTWAIAAIAFVVLIVYRSRLRREIQSIGSLAGNANAIRFRPTFRTLLLTLATSAPIPVFFWFVGGRLDAIAGNERGLLAISAACHTIALTYFPVELLRKICHPSGLAESHFDWPARVAATLRGNLRWILWIAIPLMTASRFLGAGSTGSGQDSLERYLFLGALITVCVFLARTFHPRRGVMSMYVAEHAGGWASKLSFLWYPAIVAVPAILGLLTVIGYAFTAEQLAWRFFLSLVILLAIRLAVSLMIRWTLIRRRQLRLEEAHQRRAEAEQSDGQVSEVAATLAAESNVDLVDQMKQTRRVFHAGMWVAGLIGLWIVWSDVVPALSFLEQWPTYTSTTTITEQVPGQDGRPVLQKREVPDPVTVVDWLLGILIVGVTIVAARDLPGLLEFAVLRRLPLDRSIRYATTTLVSYAIILLGLILACRPIGLHWNQVQWMAAALTFGLAFGLQEMFANFIAGIIILFEQPVRVGDVVEIDGVTGIVSKIRIRATTITDWDRKDYIVPNKEFITGKLLNWTRSDEIVRVTLTVGVAYGSDTELARKLLVEAAERQHDTLDSPPTMAVFDGFGDNSLNFTLRTFIGNYERRLHVIHDLHTAIDQAFAEAEIEISFPQRDLHLRSVPEGMKRYFAETTGKET